jgi:hypothetical protein
MTVFYTKKFLKDDHRVGTKVDAEEADLFAAFE